jgi:PPOX class probable F420-dependent enzyme
MTAEDTREFLMHARRTAKVATTRADGRPHVAPVWFILDGDDIVFMTGAGTVKGRTLARDPRVSLTVDLEEQPYTFVIVEGTAELSDDLEAMLPLSIAIARRYVGEQRADEIGRRNAVPGELLVRISPSKIIAIADQLTYD